jgi:hypothetical protein
MARHPRMKVIPTWPGARMHQFLSCKKLFATEDTGFTEKNQECKMFLLLVQWVSAPHWPKFLNRSVISLAELWFLGLLLLTVTDTVWAQIAFRAAASAGIASTGDITYGGSGAAAVRTSCGSMTPALPAGTVAGDFLLTAAVVREELAAVAMPGWNTALYDYPAGLTNYKVYLFWRIATGVDPNTITQSGTCDSLYARVSRFTGVDTADPILNATPGTQIPAANWRSQNANYVRTGTETTTVPNMMLVLAAYTRDDSAPSASPAACAGQSAFSTLTAAYVGAQTSGRDSSLWLYYGLQAAAGLKGPYCQGKTVGSDANHGLLFALRPTGLRINVPTGTVAGDVMLASIAVQPSSIVITAPAGWTLVRSTTQAAATSSRMATYYRVATAAEPASYLWSFSGAASTGATGGIMSFSGVDPVSVIDVEGGNVTASALTHSANGVTTTVANTMLVGAFEFTSTPSAANWTSDMSTSAVNQGSIAGPGNAGIRILMGYETRAATGATGTRTATASGVTADPGVAHLLALRPAVTINHFSISHSSTGVACEDQAVTISAHDSNHNAVGANGLTVALSTTNSRGTWTGIVAGGGTLTDTTAGDGAASYTFAAGSTTAQLAFRYANLASTSEAFSFNVSGGGFSETSGVTGVADDPVFTMAQAGFQFRNLTDGNTTVPTQISGKPSNAGFNAKTIRIQAIRTDAATGSCTGLFANQTRSVDLGAECNSPVTCAGQQASVNGGSIATSANNGGAGAAAYTGVSLAFNASSEADTVIAYPDAGQISLHARYDYDTGVSGFELLGSSNAFVVRPFGLAFRGANAATPVQHGVSEAASPLAAAGDNFTMTLSAYRWAPGEDANNDGVPDAGANLTDNGLTPNFAAGVSVAPGANLPGVALGTVSRGLACTNPASIAAASFSAGSATVSDWCYSETGNVFLTANSPNYIAAGVDITGNSGLDGTGGAGGYLGRFRPKHFVLSGVPILTNRSAATCAPASSFTYMDEGLRLSFDLVARNTQGVTTQNYHGPYAKLGIGTFANFDFGAKSGTTSLVARVDSSASPAGAWSNGVATISATTGVRRAAGPDGPYPGVQFGIAPVDPDGVSMNTLDFDADFNGINERANLNVTTELRFGRMRLGNGFGSTLLDLPLTLATEYFNGSYFLTNSSDSCTALPAGSIAFGFVASNLAACETRVNPATAIYFAAGVASAKLIKPGSANDGAVDLSIHLGSTASGNACLVTGPPGPAATAANTPYLQGNWGSGTYSHNPKGRYSFGQFKPADQTIYLRELY